MSGVRLLCGSIFGTIPNLGGNNYRTLSIQSVVLHIKGRIPSAAVRNCLACYPSMTSGAGQASAGHQVAAGRTKH